MVCARYIGAELTLRSGFRQSRCDDPCAGRHLVRTMAAQYALVPRARSSKPGDGNVDRHHVRARYASRHVRRAWLALRRRARLETSQGAPMSRRSSLIAQLGLAVFILVILQSVGGAAIHWLPQGHFIRWSHVGIGLVVAGCLYAQVRSDALAPLTRPDVPGFRRVERKHRHGVRADSAVFADRPARPSRAVWSSSSGSP